MQKCMVYRSSLLNYAINQVNEHTAKDNDPPYILFGRILGHQFNYILEEL